MKVLSLLIVLFVSSLALADKISPNDKIQEAIEDCDASRVERILSYDIVNVDSTDEFGQTALHHASFHGCLRIVDFLIHNKGASVHVKDKWGETPLHYASLAGRKVVVAFLIQKGADVNVEDNNGKTPLIWASIFDKRDVAKSLIIDHKADVNFQDKFGQTALHHASRKGNPKMVHLLISEHADVNVKDHGGGWSFGRTPLDLAYITNQVDVAELLKFSGAIEGKPKTLMDAADFNSD